MEEKAAVYCRLSQDDGSVGESGSIQTQRTLLTQYCKEQHISIADYYCDDGWSGTNFERPEFQRMLEDIESGKVNTVIVKDLSRFGREYAQMGMYIEHYFEQKNVRFISVAESIDSAKGLTIWCCPSPMSSTRSMRGKHPPRQEPRTRPEQEAECLWAAVRRSAIRKTPMTVTT